MGTTRRLPGACWLMPALLLPGTIAAAGGTHPCATVAEPVKRLACYDEAFPPPPEVHEAAVRRAREDFGRDEAPVTLANPGQDASDIDPRHIGSRISRVDHDNGQRRITLENGQVWRQTEATTAGHMSVGDEVVVRKGVMGSYLLVTQAGVGLRVRRIR